MKRWAFAVAVLALGFAASTPARADYYLRGRGGLVTPIYGDMNEQQRRQVRNGDLAVLNESQIRAYLAGDPVNLTADQERAYKAGR